MAFFYKLVAALLSFFVYFPYTAIPEYPVQKKKNLRTSFTILSDVHLESNNPQRFKWFAEGLRDIDKADTQSRALVFLGDNTMNGNIPETIFFFGLLKRWSHTENIFIAAGNHDLCSKNQSYDEYAVHEKRLIEANNIFLKNKLENLFYAADLDGYRLIFLSSDHDAGCDRFLSEEQFSFLEAELQNAEKTDKPLFIFSHWPAEHGETAEQTKRLEDLLHKYDNKIFFFSGHLHKGISQTDYGDGENGNIMRINVPAFGAENWGSEDMLTGTGMGYNVQVYDDEIVIRVRN